MKESISNKTKVKKNAYKKLIELELSYYEQSKLDLEDYRMNIMELHEKSENIGGSGISNQTQNKAIELLNSVSIRETERWIRNIEYAIKVIKLSPEPRKIELLEMKYLKMSHSDLAIQHALHIEQATFYRWKNEIIQIVADRQGYVL